MSRRFGNLFADNAIESCCKERLLARDTIDWTNFAGLLRGGRSRWNLWPLRGHAGKRKEH